MSIVKKITKAVVLAPVRIVQGVVEAIDETVAIMEGRNKTKRESACPLWLEYSEPKGGDSGDLITMHQQRGMPETKHVAGTAIVGCRLCAVKALAGKR